MQAKNYDAAIVIATTCTMTEVKKKCAVLAKRLKKKGVFSVKKYEADSTMKNRVAAASGGKKYNILEIEIKAENVPSYHKIYKALGWGVSSNLLDALLSYSGKNFVGATKQSESISASHFMEDDGIATDCSDSIRAALFFALLTQLELGWFFRLRYTGDGGSYRYNTKHL